MRWSVVCLIFIMYLRPLCAEPQAEIEGNDGGVVVRLNGSLFAKYVKQSGPQPVIWPIFGPTGAAYTRSFPVGPLEKTESEDHPHHRSLWFAHGDVNGYDFWANHNKEHYCEIVHRKFASLESKGSTATIVTENDWIASGEKQCEDVRAFVFGGDKSMRWIDCTVKLVASEGELKLGDTKEGTFAVRVAGTMKVDPPGQGKIVNSRGQTNKAAWGLPAEWIDYHGPVGGKEAGVAILSHPSNFRHPCKWHVRTYGLFAANPFGEVDFTPSDTKQGKVELAEGESLSLRYRVLFHSGDEKVANIEAKYEAFAGDTVGK